jgi:predicted RNA methylase
MSLAIANALRCGMTLDDATFDRVFPPALRFRSSMFWTPVEVAKLATALLAPAPGASVLDVGAGVGKLALVGALLTSARWHGIECDAELADAAAVAARELGVADRTQFTIGDITDVDWSAFDAFYLYNPFAEPLQHADRAALRQRYAADIQFVQRQLAASRRGTRVVTYHGFGGELPPGFELAERVTTREGDLELWIQRAAR